MSCFQIPELHDDPAVKDLKVALNYIDKSTKEALPKAFRVRFCSFIVATVKTTMLPHETLRLCYQAFTIIAHAKCMPIKEGKCPYYLLKLFYVYLTEIRMGWDDYHFLNVMPITDEEKAVLFLKGFPSLRLIMQYEHTRKDLFDVHLPVIRTHMQNMLDREKYEGAETDFAKLILPRWVLLYENNIRMRDPSSFLQMLKSVNAKRRASRK